MNRFLLIIAILFIIVSFSCTSYVRMNQKIKGTVILFSVEDEDLDSVFYFTTDIPSYLKIIKRSLDNKSNIVYFKKDILKKNPKVKMTLLSFTINPFCHSIINRHYKEYYSYIRYQFLE